MNEEIKNAVELSDEEMDNVAGGGAAIRIPGTNEVYLCNLWCVSQEEFSASINQLKVCKNFKLGQSSYGGNVREVGKCQSCLFFMCSKLPNKF